MRLPNHKYRFNREFPIEELGDYTKHPRLSLYVHQGYTCMTCGIVCNRLIQGQANDKAMHLDLYDAKLTRMLTVGHIIPKSRGGKWVLSNLRPLCHVCNTKEGTCIARLCADPVLFEQHLNGKEVRRMSGKPFIEGKSTVIINRTFFSPTSKVYYFGFSDSKQTYPANKVYFVS